MCIKKRKIEAGYPVLFQAADGIRDLDRSRGLVDVYLFYDSRLGMRDLLRSLGLGDVYNGHC